MAAHHHHPHCCMAQSDVLFSGERIGSRLKFDRLQQGAYRFTVQGDCNVVLSDFGKPIWSTQTKGRGVFCYLELGIDGNLGLYDNMQNIVWSSGTSRSCIGRCVLILQHDGRVALYRRLVWENGRYSLNNNNDDNFTSYVHGSMMSDEKDKDVLLSGERLYGQLKSPNPASSGDYSVFRVKDDCNLVLERVISPGNLKSTIWQSGTQWRGQGCYVILDEGGNLILYNSADRQVWATDTGTGIFKGKTALVLHSELIGIYDDPFWSIGAANPINMAVEK